MHAQAVRRSPRYMSLRTEWRKVQIGTLADAVLGAALVLAYAAIGIVLGGAR